MSGSYPVASSATPVNSCELGRLCQPYETWGAIFSETARELVTGGAENGLLVTGCCWLFHSPAIQPLEMRWTPWTRSCAGFFADASWSKQEMRNRIFLFFIRGGPKGTTVIMNDVQFLHQMTKMIPTIYSHKILAEIKYATMCAKRRIM